MGTSEDVAAEKYFTPPTLTEMLRESLMLGHSDVDEHELSTIKGTFEEWLRTVNLGGLTQHTLQVIESTRKLLIILVDEWSD